MAGEKHLLLTFRGHPVYNAAESWQFGIRLALWQGQPDQNVGTLPNNWVVEGVQEEREEPGLGTVYTQFSVAGSAGAQFAPDDYLQDYAVPAAKAFIGFAGRFSNQVSFTEARMYAIGDNGRVVQSVLGPARAGVYLNPAQAGQVTGSPLPPQNTVAASLRTQRAGRRGRGRIYLPYLSNSSLNSSGGIGSTVVDSLRNGVDNLLEELATNTNQTTNWSVRPIVTGSPWQSYGIITQVEVGDRIDTQRRRRRQIKETYSSAPVTP